MAKWIILILTILMATIAVADRGEIEVYRPREVFDLSVHLTNKTGEVLNANCSVQVKNESFDMLDDDIMNEIGGGWYNYTYNKSQTGKYFCRWNCTSGNLYVADTCDFIIEGETTMPIAVIMTVMFVILIYFFLLVYLFTQRTFTEHGLVKLLFFMIAFWVLLLPLNMAVQYNDANGGPVEVTEHLELLYQIMIWLNSFIIVYFVLWFVAQIFKKIGNTGTRLRLSNE